MLADLKNRSGSMYDILQLSQKIHWQTSFK